MALDYKSNRRLKNFQVRKVRESLPEIFTQDFSKLVTFLEKYYDFLDSSGGSHAFGDDIKQIFSKKDIHEMPEDLLNNLVSELAGGLNTGENFTDKRYALTRLAELHKNSGSKLSAQEFFRLFFQENVEIEYPKKDIFKVGEETSKIGVDSIKFIQNYQRYQIFSILIKSSLSINTWKELYTKFIHPAGFYIEGEVSAVGVTSGLPNQVQSITDSNVAFLVQSEAELGMARGFTQLTTLIDSAGGGGTSPLRISDINKLVSDYQNVSLSFLDNNYGSIRQILTPNSFTFDDTTQADISNTFETMDNEFFTRVTSDSSF